MVKRASSSGEGLTKWIYIEGKTNLVYFRDLSFYATRYGWVRV
jgi:hypothetical protein